MIAPAVITEYLDSLDPSVNCFGYLELDNDNNIIDFDGSLDTLTHKHLHIGQSATSQLPCLEGLLPGGTKAIVIEHVHLSNDQYFDIHFFSRHSSQWVTFIDQVDSGKDKQEQQQMRLQADLKNETKGKC